MPDTRDILGLVDSVFVELSIVEESTMLKLRKLGVTEIITLGADIQDGLESLHEARIRLMEAHTKYQRLLDEC